MAYGKTIAAISTPPGKGGVAIIRISGEDAIKIAEGVFFPKSKKALSSYPKRTQVYGDIRYNGECIDDGMATCFFAPESYTGEDIVEISCHGGTLVTRTVLEALFSTGAHPAEPGEFTRRAFINGKLSLVEAEGVGELLEARTREQIRLFSGEARGRLAGRIEEIRSDLVELLSSVFARIDYPDEDLGEFNDTESLERLYNIKGKIDSLLSTYPTGKAISEGIPTVICGKPNVGKSTLYNAILGENAAIVTDIEGTTRDVLTATAPLGKVLLKLSDTAGVRSDEGIDAVEKIGISKTKEKIGDASLIIAVFDLSRNESDGDRELIELLSHHSAAKIALLNKCDLEQKFDTGMLEGKFDEIIHICAKEKETDTVSALSSAVERLFINEELDARADSIVSSARHNASLTRACEFVKAAISAFESGVYQDAAASEVERALSAIAEIDGRAVSEEIVSDIFSKFCVGK